MSFPVGIIANPLSGRDVRRIAARADTSTPQSKRNQVARIVIGAVAAGAKRVLVMKEPFRVSTAAIENLEIDASLEVIDVDAKLDASDTVRAAEAMRKAGCAALVVLGGDGTNRAIARIWPDAPLVPLSTGTNNVFPRLVEPTIAGAAAGLVASGVVTLAEAASASKCVRVAIDGEPDDMALVDAAFLVDDHVGNLMPFEPEKLRALVLARAEPAGIGMSPIGGLLQPVGAADDGRSVRDLRCARRTGPRAARAGVGGAVSARERRRPPRARARRGGRAARPGRARIRRRPRAAARSTARSHACASSATVRACSTSSARCDSPPSAAHSSTARTGTTPTTSAEASPSATDSSVAVQVDESERDQIGGARAPRVGCGLRDGRVRSRASRSR